MLVRDVGHKDWGVPMWFMGAEVQLAFFKGIPIMPHTVFFGSGV